MSSSSSPSSSHRHSRYTLTCPECRAEVSLSARRLLVRVDEGTATSGEVLFTCLSCHATVTVELDDIVIGPMIRLMIGVNAVNW